MARPLNIEFPGALYYITTKGIENKAIFMDDQDKFRQKLALNNRIRLKAA
jgi:hypothetical protein